MNPLNKTLSDNHWDFRGAQTNLLTHSLHAYPARMVPNIAGELIGRYTEVGDLVIDPFCGSGTTLVEGTVANRRMYGIDLNPFAVFMSRVKTTPIRPSNLEREWNTLKLDLHFSRAKNRELENYSENAHTINLDFWYKKYIIRDLKFIDSRIDTFFPSERDPLRNFFRLMFAKTAREVSNQRLREFKRWRLADSSLKVFRPRPLKRFEVNVEKALPFMEQYYKETKGRVHRRVILGDARTFKTSKRPSLILTSPPYGDSGTTVAYGQYSSFALEWLHLTNKNSNKLDSLPLSDSSTGFDCLKESGLLEDTYHKISDRDLKRSDSVLSFFVGMKQVLSNFSKVLDSGGTCCMVVGNRRVRGVHVPTDGIISELAYESGFRLVDRFSRDVLHKVMPFATKPWNSGGDNSIQKTMNTETILVFDLK